MLSYKAKKAKLAQLIRYIGELTNEDPVFLEEYIQDRLKACADNLDAAILCFEDLKQQQDQIYGKN